MCIRDSPRTCLFLLYWFYLPVNWCMNINSCICLINASVDTLPFGDRKSIIEFKILQLTINAVPKCGTFSLLFSLLYLQKLLFYFI